MRRALRILKTLVIAVVVIMAVGAGWLYVGPPELLRVGDGYAAKIVCSNVFIAGRDANTVLAEDVQAPGNPLLRLIHIDVDQTQKRVTARMLGLFAANYAVYREGFGCASVPDGNFEAARQTVADAPALEAKENQEVRRGVWPEGDEPGAFTDARVGALLASEDLMGPNMRAVVVVHNGRIVGEAYGDGFGANTPLIGWSMTKTVNAAMVGRLMLDGKIGFDDAALLPQWRNDQRSQITLGQLMGMESGLGFNENYGTVADVTRMLYLDADETALPASRALTADPGTQFNYSSGTSVLISRIWMDRVANARQARAFPKQALFDPLGMDSAVLETDARGTFAGSSYLYATARDWVRFGQFLLQDGVWNGERLLPESFMEMMRTPTAASGGAYSRAQAWLRPPGGSDVDSKLPADTLWLEGHDGQSMAIVPSANLVVLRLGLTPSWLRYRPQILLKEVLATLEAGVGSSSATTDQ
jgi:CubicO group peptidase (beta-lactamase class C family)